MKITSKLFMCLALIAPTLSVLPMPKAEALVTAFATGFFSHVTSRYWSELTKNCDWKNVIGKAVHYGLPVITSMGFVEMLREAFENNPACCPQDVSYRNLLIALGYPISMIAAYFGFKAGVRKS
jgi:hypothetical protein